MSMMFPPPSMIGAQQGQAPSQGAMPPMPSAQPPMPGQGGGAPAPTQQLMQLNQTLSQALQTYASTFPGAEQEIRQMMGLLQQAQGKQIQVLEQMLGPQQTPQAPY